MRLNKIGNQKHIELDLSSEIDCFRRDKCYGDLSIVLYKPHSDNTKCNYFIEEDWRKYCKDKWGKDEFNAIFEYRIFADTVYSLQIESQYCDHNDYPHCLTIYFEVTKDEELKCLNMKEAYERIFIK